MVLTKWSIAGIICLLVGLSIIVKYFTSLKEKNIETTELPMSLQYASLLIFVGLLIVLSNWFSFTAVLLMFLSITGICWGIYKLIRRKNKNNKAVIYNGAYKLIDFVQGFFIIFAIVFVVRTFLVEPFVIPTSSMRPGLEPGDFLLVNKFTYGIRTPIINNVLFNINQVKRGDVIVFIPPPEAGINTNYIKRVIGIPGDEISYVNKVLKINGEIISDKLVLHNTSYTDDSSIDRTVDKYIENLGSAKFEIFMDPKQSGFDYDVIVQKSFKPNHQYCKYFFNDELKQGLECKIPPNKYFMMGDNRDNSTDGRYFGFIDNQDIIGKAMIVWMNFHNWKRIGTIIK